MKIALVDQPEWMGGRLYVENLARGLAGLPSSERPEILWLGARKPEHASLRDIEFGYVEATFKLTRFERYAKIARICRERGVDFCYSVPFRGVGFGSAFWIPDLQHIHLPEMFSRWHGLRRTWLFRASMLASSDVVVSSSDAANDVKRLGLFATRPVHVLHFATPLAPGDVAAPEELRAAISDLPDQYLYVPNQLWRHKDHPTALRALAELRRRGRDIAMVFSGDPFDRRNQHWASYVDALAEELGVADSIRFTGMLDRRVQLRLLYESTLIVQPSLFEGWSTVLEDGRALGKSVVASDLSVHREQALSSVKYFEPGDPLALAQAVVDFIDSETAGGESVDLLAERASQRVAAVARTLIAIGSASQR